MKRVFITILSIFVIILSFTSCSKKEENINLNGIRKIGELATIESYYHNVAKINKENDNIFQKPRKFWIEYEGVATIGVDMSLVKTEIKDNVITITMPHATLFDIDKTDEPFRIIESDDGIIKNKITTDEQSKAIDEAQENMKKTVLENKALFTKAEERTKDLIENYINTLSKSVNKEYIIEWKIAK